MKIIVPMAGTGARFVQQGYSDPKPLIHVGGKRIIEYIVNMFSKDDEFVFICNQDHINSTNMKLILKELVPSCQIIVMPSHKYGPVYTVKQAYEFIGDDEEVIISYCDNPMVWDYDAFKSYLKQNSPDGCILTHTGFHPHTLNNTKMAFLKVTGHWMDEIKEKSCYTTEPTTEHASTGIYYFKTGAMIKSYFDRALNENVTYAGEYYVTLVYNLLVQDGLKVGYFDTPFVTVFGTPEEVKSFESWKTILTSGQVKNEEDLIKCYNYWKEYSALIT